MKTRSTQQVYTWCIGVTTNRVVARPILVVGNMSNCFGSLPRARGSTKLFMFNYGANIAEVGPCSQTVHVMGPCNKLNSLLTVFFLCDIWFSSSLAVSQINAKWTIFEICAGRHNIFLSECWAKIVSPGQACPAPPTVATTLHKPNLHNNATNVCKAN